MTHVWTMEHVAQVDMALESRSKGLGSDSYCWLRLKRSDKLLIPCCLCLPSNDRYPVDKNCVWVAQAACLLLWRVRCILPGKDDIVQQVCVCVCLNLKWWCAVYLYLYLFLSPYRNKVIYAFHSEHTYIFLVLHALFPVEWVLPAVSMWKSHKNISYSDNILHWLMQNTDKLQIWSKNI